MDEKYDGNSVITIILATLVLIAVSCLWRFREVFSRESIIQFGIVIVIIVSAVHGTLAGAVIPVVSCLICGIAFQDVYAVGYGCMLLVFGLSTGHFSDRFKIRDGEFAGALIVDYIMIEIVASIMAWVCIYTLGVFFIRKGDMRVYLYNGVANCGIALGEAVLICLPLLLFCNSVYKNKRMVDKANKEYLYDNR